MRALHGRRAHLPCAFIQILRQSEQACSRRHARRCHVGSMHAEICAAVRALQGRCVRPACRARGTGSTASTSCKGALCGWHAGRGGLGPLLPRPARALCVAGMQGAADWVHCFHELRRYREEHGREGPPFKWRDPVADFTANLARWYHKQPDLFRQRLLLPDEVRAPALGTLSDSPNCLGSACCCRTRCARQHSELCLTARPVQAAPAAAGRGVRAPARPCLPACQSESMYKLKTALSLSPFVADEMATLTQ
jgi:hypothetical protein